MYVKTLVVIPNQQYTISTPYGSYCVYRNGFEWELHKLSARITGPSDGTYISTHTDLQDIRTFLSEAHARSTDEN